MVSFTTLALPLVAITGSLAQFLGGVGASESVSSGSYYNSQMTTGYGGLGMMGGLGYGGLGYGGLGYGGLGYGGLGMMGDLDMAVSE
ncbi:hypothetical protein DL89DRAFT_78773 [Linderina pennispora]|uniref:Uncharacterized protein n=1 Tax=Linderina pennispora TaxID=61395 RepID=A0A1Y1VXE6_9FUNG|nr:uncharacterized protein DL89DRAFT_78773 [Linderina pennispora]ORX65981.1 hypothetical protein DL89DRAFT_78773 [Linderina pennispora]